MIVSIITLACMVILLTVLLLVERSRAVKREDNLINRLMARDYSEFAANENHKDLVSKLKAVKANPVEAADDLEDFRDTLPVT